MTNFESELEKMLAAATLPDDFWSCTELAAPIPLLHQLHDRVISRNEKRLPKWKFRFAADLAIQLQPKVTRKHLISFEGVALQTSDPMAELFTTSRKLREHPHPYRRISFQLYSDGSDCDGDADRWLFKPSSPRRGTFGSVSGLVELRERLPHELRPERFALTPDFMLSPFCLWRQGAG